MKKKRRRRRISFGTMFMLLLTALVAAACVLFLSMIVGTDMYQRTEEFVRMVAEQGIFTGEEKHEPTPTPWRMITFVDEDTPAPAVQLTPTPVPQRSTITIAAGGAIYAPKAVRQGAQAGGSFDFTPAFEGLRSVFAKADLAIATLETTTAGQSHGYGNYNTPAEILDALRASGVDLLALATERALDKGYEGLDLTVSELTTRGLAYTGLNAESASSGRATMMRVGGIQVAVLSYTYGLSDEGRQNTQDDKRAVVSMIDTNAMIQDVTHARVNGANLVIVLPHWGTKNKHDTPDTVRILAKQLAEAGADIILGTHPNVVQQTERLRVTRSDGLSYEAVVCYSLGSLMTDARTEENTAGMIAQIGVTYDPVTRRTTLGALECVPVYIASQREENRTVYRAVNAQDEEALSLLTQSEWEKAARAAEIVREAATGAAGELGAGQTGEATLTGGHG